MFAPMGRSLNSHRLERESLLLMHRKTRIGYRPSPLERLFKNFNVTRAASRLKASTAVKVRLIININSSLCKLSRFRPSASAESVLVAVKPLRTLCCFHVPRTYFHFSSIVINICGSIFRRSLIVSKGRSNQVKQKTLLSS